MRKKVTFGYQLNTENYSFLKMHKILKDMGIKNNKFFLKLYDKDLRYIDPLDEENLTLEQQAKIIREVKRNFWYFIREVVRIPRPNMGI